MNQTKSRINELYKYTAMANCRPSGIIEFNKYTAMPNCQPSGINESNKFSSTVQLTILRECNYSQHLAEL